MLDRSKSQTWQMRNKYLCLSSITWKSDVRMVEGLGPGLWLMFLLCVQTGKRKLWCSFHFLWWCQSRIYGCRFIITSNPACLSQSDVQVQSQCNLVFSIWIWLYTQFSLANMFYNLFGWSHLCSLWGFCFRIIWLNKNTTHKNIWWSFQNAILQCLLLVEKVGK